MKSTKLYKCFTDHPLFRILERVENFIDILEDNRNLKNSALEEAKLRSNISSIHEQYDETKNLDLKKDSDSIEKDTPEKNISIKIKEDSNLNNHFRKETEEEKSIRLKNLLIRQQTSCDKVFVRYLASVSRVVNQEYYKKVLSFVLLLRECINENAIFLERKRLTPNDDIFPREEERGRTKKEYCRFRNAEMIPEIFNEFLDNYVKKKIGIMLAINEIAPQLPLRLCLTVPPTNFPPSLFVITVIFFSSRIKMRKSERKGKKREHTCVITLDPPSQRIKCFTTLYRAKVQSRHAFHLCVYCKCPAQ